MKAIAKVLPRLGNGERASCRSGDHLEGTHLGAAFLGVVQVNDMSRALWASALKV